MGKIAVVGAGGVGGYFGAALANAGNDVTFLARGSHLRAMQSHGLKVLSEAGDIHISPVKTAEHAEEIGPVEIVLFSVKLRDTVPAATACKPLLDEGGSVFTFQNGVESADVIGEIVGMDNVVAGAAYIASEILEPGVIKHTGKAAKLVFGELSGDLSRRTREFLKLCNDADIHAELSEDAKRAIWLKFALLAPFSGLTTLTRAPAAKIRNNKETSELFNRAVEEVIELSMAMGTGLIPSDFDKVRGNFDKFPSLMTSSMYHDLAAGRPLELAGLSGAVARLGKRYNVDTPVHQFIASALSIHQNGSVD